MAREKTWSQGVFGETTRRLIDGVRAGDKQAKNGFFAKVLKKAVTKARHKLPEDRKKVGYRESNDIANSVAVKMISEIDEGKYDPVICLQSITRRVANVIKMTIRSEKADKRDMRRVVSADEPNPVTDEPNPVTDGKSRSPDTQAADGEMVEKVLEGASADQRRAMHDFYYLSMTSREIAEQEQTSDSAIRHRLKTVRDAARERFPGHIEGECHE